MIDATGCVFFVMIWSVNQDPSLTHRLSQAELDLRALHEEARRLGAVSYTHLTLPTILLV